MTNLEYVLYRLGLADEGQHQVGNILIAVGYLVEIVECQQARIEALERICAERERERAAETLQNPAADATATAESNSKDRIASE